MPYNDLGAIERALELFPATIDDVTTPVIRCITFGGHEVWIPRVDPTVDFTWTGFEWIDFHDADNSVVFSGQNGSL